MLLILWSIMKKIILIKRNDFSDIFWNNDFYLDSDKLSNDLGRNVSYILYQVA